MAVRRDRPGAPDPQPGRPRRGKPSIPSSPACTRSIPRSTPSCACWKSEARAEAETADAARARGHALPPLHGVPVTTKINVDQAGLPTDNGVIPLKDLIAKEDSPVVANLKHAGAIIVGRTNAPAFSMRIFTDNALHGRTLNPRDPSVTPGGSSGGAGAATRDRHRRDRPRQRHRRLGAHPRLLQRCGRPAHRLRPHPVLQSDRRPHPAARSAPMLMAVQGPHTRTVRDARLALEVMARGDRRDWRWNDVPMRGAAAGAADQGRDRAGSARRQEPSRAGRGGAAGRQASAGRRLRRRGDPAARHRARRRVVAPDLRHRCVRRPVADDAEDGRSGRHRGHAGLARPSTSRSISRPTSAP